METMCESALIDGTAWKVRPYRTGFNVHERKKKKPKWKEDDKEWKTSSNLMTDEMGNALRSQQTSSKNLKNCFINTWRAWQDCLNAVEKCFWWSIRFWIGQSKTETWSRKNRLFLCSRGHLCMKWWFWDYHFLFSHVTD